MRNELRVVSPGRLSSRTRRSLGAYGAFRARMHALHVSPRNRLYAGIYIYLYDDEDFIGARAAGVRRYFRSARVGCMCIFQACVGRGAFI